MTIPLYALNFRVDERMFALWANAQGFAQKNGSHVPGVLFRHALIELLGDRAPRAFGTVRHHNFGLSVAFYSTFNLDSLRRPSRGRGAADIQNSMKFQRAFCTPAPTFEPGELVAFLIRMRPHPKFGAPRSEGVSTAKADEYMFLRACQQELALDLIRCGEQITIELIEFKYELLSGGNLAVGEPMEWAPTLLLRCEMNVTDPAGLYDLMLAGVGQYLDHGYGMPRISVEWRAPIITI